MPPTSLRWPWRSHVAWRHSQVRHASTAAAAACVHAQLASHVQAQQCCQRAALHEEPPEEIPGPILPASPTLHAGAGFMPHQRLSQQLGRLPGLTAALGDAGVQAYLAAGPGDEAAPARHKVAGTAAGVGVRSHHAAAGCRIAHPCWCWCCCCPAAAIAAAGAGAAEV